MVEIPISKILGLLTLDSQGKWHLHAAPVVNHREYYEGERWWLPPMLGRVESCESVYVHGSSMHQKCSNYALTNLLFSLCRSKWIIDSFIIHPNPHPRGPTYPSYPKNIVSLRTYCNFFLFCYFHFRIHIWIFQGIWGCVTNNLFFVQINTWLWVLVV